MNIPDELNPRRIADSMGISMAELALRLRISYHVLHSWARRGTAPPHTVRFIADALPGVRAELQAERAKLDPVEQAKLASRPAKLPGLPPDPDKRPRLLRRRV